MDNICGWEIESGQYSSSSEPTFRLKRLRSKNFVLGTVWKKPIATRSAKWNVTFEEWPDVYFAEKACPGAGYFITKDAVVKLRDAISQVKFIVLSIGY